MALSAFLGSGDRKIGFKDENMLGLPKPEAYSSYIDLADKIEKVFNRIVVMRAVDADSYQDLIRIAFKCFGEDMYFLKDMVSDVDKFGAMTGRFLQDTLSFVTEGKERQMEITTWGSMLDGPVLELPITNTTITDERTTTKQVRYGKQPVVEEKRCKVTSTKDSDYLCEWLCRKGGMTDLMYTLQYCYGKSSLVELVNEPTN